MSLTKIFPDFEIVRAPASGLPTKWSELLSVGSDLARSEVADFLGLPSHSKSRHVLLSGGEVGVIVPRRKGDKRNTRLWRLAIQLTGEFAMVFDCPHNSYFVGSKTYDHAYFRIIESMGSLRFTQYSGNVVWPNLIPPLSQRVRDSIDDRRLLSNVNVFFDHHTGDFDCWIDSNYFDVWHFDHDSCKLDLYSSGGFLEWLNKSMEEHLI